MVSSFDRCNYMRGLNFQDINNNVYYFYQDIGQFIIK